MKTNISWNGIGRFWNLHTLWAKILTYICRWFCFLLTHFSGFALDAARGLLCQTRACGCYKCVIYDGPMWLWLLGQTSSGLKRSTCSYSKFEVQKVYYPFIVYTFTQQTWHFLIPDWQPLAASTVLREYYVFFFVFLMVLFCSQWEPVSCLLCIRAVDQRLAGSAVGTSSQERRSCRT